MPYNLKEIVEQNVHTDWKPILLNIISQKPKIVAKIESKLNQDEITYSKHLSIFPPKSDIFNTFNHFNFADLKVVIIGQDPYHGPGQANGLCFSVHKGIKSPPSLVNMFKELKNDIPGFIIPKDGDLTSWCDQGVLLMNASLSVLQGHANSYKGEWNKFTDIIMKYIGKYAKNPIVFLLWGRYAQDKARLITDGSNKHIILKAVHPSPLSASKGWFGSAQFSKANKELVKLGFKEIDWKL